MEKLSFKLKHMVIEFNDPLGFLISDLELFQQRVSEISGFVEFDSDSKIKFLYSDTPYEYMRQMQSIAREIGFTKI